jgi:hypothetical protein
MSFQPLQGLFPCYNRPISGHLTEKYKMINLRKKFTALACATAMISLGACTGVNLQADISAVEAQVQADANTLCGFVPTAATILAFIPGVGAIAADAATIAEGICSAIAQAPVVTAPPSVRMRAAGGADVQVAVVRTPRGPVPVVGHFTR